jgi:homoserine O-acetyltransferase
VIQNFKFRSGETLPELNMHYRTIGTLKTNSAGVATNAVLAGHGTARLGRQLAESGFRERALWTGPAVGDATKYFIILPDGIGHGKSSKPSDGLHMKFPRYTYDDMVEALHEVCTKKLGVNHLRLVMGTSMGGMQTWVWGEMYPDFMDALMPLASNPVEIAGRNRVWRFMASMRLRTTSDWMGGEYKTQPMRGLTTAEDLLLLAGSAPLNWQE